MLTTVQLNATWRRYVVYAVASDIMQYSESLSESARLDLNDLLDYLLDDMYT